MYYSNEDIDRFEGQVEGAKGESYVRRAALAIGDILTKTPAQYKTFGVYWWAIKAALRKYYAGDAWFKGEYFDQLMYERAWHGSLYRTVLAGGLFHSQHRTISSSHEWTDADGNEREYTLIDYDAGF